MVFSMPSFNMNVSEWGLKMQSEIYLSIHMAEFKQHFKNKEVISADGEESKINWHGPLRCPLGPSYRFNPF